MFERYTEKARRTIFFARYEASMYGSPQVESEHFLLGLVREFDFLRKWVSTEGVHKHLEARGHRMPQSSTSLDIGMGNEVKRILAFGAEEAERLASRAIDCPHLALGVLREDHCLAAELLRQFGVTSEILASAIPPSVIPTGELVPQEPEPTAAGPLAKRLAAQLTASEDALKAITEAQAWRKLKRRDWNCKQALGHLIDLATAHHQWFARASVEPYVTGVSYPAPDWAVAQKYEMLPWRQLTQQWIELMDLLVHVLPALPAERWTVPCRIGLDPAMPVSELAAAYSQRVEDVLVEILTRA